MDFEELVQKRRSVRSYQDREVEAAKLDALLAFLRAAPSAGNLQAYEVLVLRDPKTRRALVPAATNQGFLAQAPIVLAFLADAGRSGKRYRERGRDLYALQDATIACTYAMLAATSMGLATCWVGAFEEQEVRRILRVPEHLRPVALLPVGYPGEAPEATSRRPVEDLVHEGPL